LWLVCDAKYKIFIFHWSVFERAKFIFLSAIAIN
jgi:hypothetical protein